MRLLDDVVSWRVLVRPGNPRAARDGGDHRRFPPDRGLRLDPALELGPDDGACDVPVAECHLTPRVQYGHARRTSRARW